MKTAVVTGSTGFIGSHLAQHLVDSGWRVLGLGRAELNSLPFSVRERLQGTEYQQIAMEELATLKDSIGGLTLQESVFFNLAWGGSSGLSDKDVGAQLRNVSQSEAAVRLAAALGCQHFIQVGTMEEEFLREYLKNTQDPKSRNRHVIYAAAKTSAWMACAISAHETGIGFSYVLNGHVIGPDDSKDSFLQETLRKLLTGVPLELSSGKQRFDVISVHDLVEAYRQVALLEPEGDRFFIGSGSARPLRDYVREMHGLYAPDSEIVFGNAPFEDVNLSEGCFSTERLVEKTGFVPRWSFADSLEELTENLRSRGIV